MPYYRNRSFIVICLFIVLIDFALLQFPLTNILGFEYSFINSIVLCFLVGLFTVISIRKNQFIFDKELLSELFWAVLSFLCLPFVISLIASFFILNCSLLDGIYFYFVLAVPSGLVGISLALISFLIWKRFNKTIFIVMFLLVLSIPFFEFYFNPQVYFYNPVFGYYPGTIYDETIKIDWKLISYRLMNLVYFGSVCAILLRVFLKTKSVFVSRKYLFLTIFFLSAVLFYSSSGYLGYSLTTGLLKNNLGGLLKTQHFEIYFDKSLSKSKVEVIGLSSEYFYEEIKTELKIKHDILVTIFVFRDNIQKKNLFGSANADVSKLWLQQIFVDANSFSSTLKHEIVHAVSSEFGKTIFKIPGNLSMALTEGIASAIDYCPGYYSNHYLAYLAYKNGYSIPVAKLFSGFNFFSQVSSLSYIYSGSFCRYLIDTYGAEKFKRYYSENDFDLIYGKSVEQVEKDYLMFLKQQDYQNNNHSARLYFARPPIFKKVCVRFFSEQIDDGWRLFNLKDYNNAKNKFKNLLNYSGSYPALFGYVSSLNKLENYKSAFKILKSEIKKYDSTSYEYNLKNILADQYVLINEFENAEKLYSELLLKSPSYGFIISSKIKLGLSEQPVTLREYVSGEDSTKLSILKSMNSDSIFYASLPLLVDEKDDDSTVSRITSAIVKDISMPNSTIQVLGILSLAKKCFQEQDFETAKLLTIKAMQYKQDNNLNEVLYSQLKKVNWMCNFADDIKSKFYFNKLTE